MHAVNWENFIQLMNGGTLPGSLVFMVSLDFLVLLAIMIRVRRLGARTRGFAAMLLISNLTVILVLSSGILQEYNITGFDNHTLHVMAMAVQVVFLLCCYWFLGDGSESLERETGVLTSRILRRDAEGLLRRKRKCCVVAVKLQGLEHLNNVLNHEVQRDVMRQMGNWMLGQCSEHHSLRVYRVTQGSFVFLMRNESEKNAAAFGQTVLERFRCPWRSHHTDVTINAQVWLANMPSGIQNMDQLIAFAGASYDPELSDENVHKADEMQKSAREQSIERAIHEALEHKAFKVYYQPIYDTRSGAIHSAEALVRLIDPELGFISPEEFIPIAEKTGTITSIGESVFEQVCRFLAEERPERYGLDYVEVNLSTVQCMNAGIVERLKQIADMYNIDPSRINLEITETSVVLSETTMKRVMKELEAAGFTFALDDFGTGNANYSYILNYPFRLIKIDKSFLWEANKNRNNRVLFDNMVRLIKELDRQAVCEGVETREQRDALIAKGVDYLQGYYYSKPIPREDFMFYLRNFDL